MNSSNHLLFFSYNKIGAQSAVKTAIGIFGWSVIIASPFIFFFFKFKIFININKFIAVDLME